MVLIVDSFFLLEVGDIVVLFVFWWLVVWDGGWAAFPQILYTTMIVYGAKY